MATIINLNIYHFKRSLYGLTLIGTWLLADGRHRPCLVLIRASEEMHDHTFPCVVTVDRAWVWDELVGDARQAARIAYIFAQALRLTPDRHTLIMLASLIHDHLSDLLTIPPYGTRNGGNVIGHVTRTDHSTGKVTEAEIFGDV